MFSHNFTIKLCDFGLSQETSPSTLITTFGGTECYLAPEVLMRQPYNGYKVDVFALGVILFIMLTGRRPFRSARRNDWCYQYMVKGDMEGFWKHAMKGIELVLSGEAVDLIGRMLCYKSEDRIGMDEIKEHRFMKKEMEREENVVEELERRCEVIRKRKIGIEGEGGERFEGIDAVLEFAEDGKVMGKEV